MKNENLIKIIVETLKENEAGLINKNNYIKAVKSDYYLQVAESVVEKFNYIPCCMGEAEQLLCSCDNPNGFKEMEEGRETCSKCKKPY